MTVVTMTVVIVWSEVMPTGTKVQRNVVCLEGGGGGANGYLVCLEGASRYVASQKAVPSSKYVPDVTADCRHSMFSTRDVNMVRDMDIGSTDRSV